MTKSMNNEKTYGSEANQSTWQAKLVALRQGNNAPSFRRSDSATDACAEARFTFGKPRKNEWDFQGKVAQQPISKVERQDKRESGSHIFTWTPKADGICYPAAKQPEGVVAVSQGNRVAKRFRVDSVDRVTGEDVSLLVTLVTNEVHILCYGKHFVFSKTNRSKATFCDSRDGVSEATPRGKSKPLSFAKSELIRIFGLTVGLSKYAELVALPPKRPATTEGGSPGPVNAGSSASTSQGSNLFANPKLTLKQIKKALRASARAERTVVSVRSGTGIESTVVAEKQFDSQGIRIA